MIKQQNAYLNFKEEEIMEGRVELEWLLQKNCLTAIQKNQKNLYIDQPKIIQWPWTFRFNFVLYWLQLSLLLWF